MALKSYILSPGGERARVRGGQEERNEKLMKLSSLMPPDISLFCKRCSEVLSGLAENEAHIEFIRSELPTLLLNKPFFTKILNNLVEGGKYPDLQYSTMFDNEFLLYTDAAHLFSLRLFLWGPGEYTPVHDHNSWGVIGPISGELEVIDYRREDDGSREGYACLVELERLRLLPGQTASTFPLNEGIHKTGNPTQESILSLSLYGNPLPRGYINGFDTAGHSVYRILSPKMKKKLLAIQVLKSLNRVIGGGTS
jgi:predicted metal-dependent enzyme (double-stranded beta helix superfamily)